MSAQSMPFIAILLCFFSYQLVVGQESLLQQAETAFQDKDYTKAVRLSKSYLKEYPDHIKAQELLGTAYASQENWEDSKEVYKKLVTAYPSQANYHFKYGGSLGLYAKNVSKFKAVLLLDEIKFHLKQATLLEPKHIDARWALVQLYMELPGIVGGSKSTAKQYANELESISKVDGKLAFGFIEEYDGQLALAEAYYKEAVSIGNSSSCYQKLVDIQLKQNKKKEAISTLKQAYAQTSDTKFNNQLKELIN